MKNIIVRRFEGKDYDRVLELNEESVHFLSPLTREKLESMVGELEIFNVIEVDNRVEGFVLTLREGKKYDSINYLWFSNHYDHFLYIDRIVISLKIQGKGLGSLLYQSVFDHGKLTNVPYIAAEIDISPPNPGSLIFHGKFGFKEVGQQTVGQGKKLVSLQIANLTLGLSSGDEGG